MYRPTLGEVIRNTVLQKLFPGTWAEMERQRLQEISEIERDIRTLNMQNAILPGAQANSDESSSMVEIELKDT